MEVISRTATSVNSWDQALSAGHAVWALGNDDAHDNLESSVGVCWSLVHADTAKSKESILSSLIAGRTIAIRGWRGQMMQQLRSLDVKNDCLYLILNQPADSIILKTDRGRVLAFVTNQSVINVQIPKSSTYVRAEIFETEPWNTYTRMYLNPVIRTRHLNSFRAHNNQATPNYFKSLIYWIFVGVLQLLCLRFIVKLNNV